MAAQVTVSHLGARPRAFKVKALTAEGAAMLEFFMDDGRKTSVAEYFELKYQKRCTSDHLSFFCQPSAWAPPALLASLSMVTRISGWLGCIK